MSRYHAVRGVTARGNSYLYVEKIMPRIPDEFLECVVYIYPSVEAAQEGKKFGGTGFLISRSIQPGLDMTYVVTNSHVAVGGRAIRLNTRQGTSEVIPIKEEQWIHHRQGDDVAVAVLIPSKTRFRYKTLSTEHFLTREQMVDLNVGPGDEVFFMGRFIAHDGKQKNQPIARFGVIAMMPGEPVFQPGRDFYQDSFLIEGRSLSGFSGSPVMLHIPLFSMRYKGGTFAPEAATNTVTMLLLGIDWGSMILPDEKLTNTSIMGVVPIWKLEELLDDPEVIEMRDAILEEEIARLMKEGGAVLDVAEEPDEYDRFRSLLGKVVQVPKSEIDEARKKE